MTFTIQFERFISERVMLHNIVYYFFVIFFVFRSNLRSHMAIVIQDFERAADQMLGRLFAFRKRFSEFFHFPIYCRGAYIIFLRFCGSNNGIRMKSPFIHYFMYVRTALRRGKQHICHYQILIYYSFGKAQSVIVKYALFYEEKRRPHMKLFVKYHSLHYFIGRLRKILLMRIELF